jgi:hypothetical protein
MSSSDPSKALLMQHFLKDLTIMLSGMAKKRDFTVQPQITYIYFGMHSVYRFPTVRGHNPN